MEILVGTSGYSYRSWMGIFYPRSLKQPDLLAYYARRFPAVEINTTYYGIPSPKILAGWTEKTPPSFEFVVKAHKDMTHAGSLNRKTFKEFREALEPVCEAGMLGCVLAQFPWAFKPGPESHRFLKSLRRELKHVPVVVEFRNSAWVSDETFERLKELGLGFCCVDEPRFKGLMPPVIATTSPIGYVRFHGRNYKKWFHHAESHERYDYRYSAEELQEWVPRIEQVASETEKTYVFFNNHHEAKSVFNAQELADLMQLTLAPPLAAAA